ncbi:MAG: 1-(5-phosphoribosyl)-5-[(5-phosphoribosylamino)methylideneamino]imidazole-4-carboxamide isomerase [Chloroflexi bacterium]|jgi:phosphoribosylformimino-5-aminoimidazole carboxamide ribotide isomerase|nr:1-(5-phosphoribosyl)-5-[(5-phosphoribosylamino)methylideneamino]imidazole-4-carboxamide isomerase [Chloroflexota bacterium]
MTDKFILFPAIDLRNGAVVRLSEGDPGRQTIYGDEPRDWAERWQSEGADWLHVVNLDGAFGEAVVENLAALHQILNVGIKVQFGGGLRDEDSLRAAFDAGISRAVIGTAAIENPALVDWALEIFGSERVVVGIDARDGMVRIRGWEESAGVQAADLARDLCRRGLKWCNFTDVARDGLQSGVNVAATSALAQVSGLSVVASGGVATLDDVRRVRDAGLAGVIIGRALYEGNFSIADCVEMMNAE